MLPKLYYQSVICYRFWLLSPFSTKSPPSTPPRSLYIPLSCRLLRSNSRYRRSSCRSKSEFARARLLGESFKVITVDKSAIEYYRKLSSLTAQVHKIGVNYNQMVRILHTTERLQTFEAILKEIYRLTKELLDLQKQAVESIVDFKKKEQHFK